MLTRGIPSDFRGGVHIYLLKLSYAIESVPSLSDRAIAYRWRSLPRVRRHRASRPQGSSSNGCCLCITMDQLICASLFRHPLMVCINSGHVESTGGVYTIVVRQSPQVAAHPQEHQSSFMFGSEKKKCVELYPISKHVRHGFPSQARARLASHSYIRNRQQITIESVRSGLPITQLLVLSTRDTEMNTIFLYNREFTMKCQATLAV